MFLELVLVVLETMLMETLAFPFLACQKILLKAVLVVLEALAVETVGIVILPHSGIPHSEVLLLPHFLPIPGLPKEQLSRLVEPDREEVNHAGGMS